MGDARDIPVEIEIAKSRTVEDETYIYQGFARESSVLTTEIGWAWVRTHKTTGDTDWANLNGRGTKRYDFTGPINDELPVGITFGE